MATSDWLCCFCGEAIEEKAPDPITLTVTTSENASQNWCCHAKCFKDRMSQELIFDPAIF